MNCPNCGRENPAEASFCMARGTGMAGSLSPETSPPIEATTEEATEATTASGFVDRREELRELMAALAEVLAGKGRLVMLAGEPGIGKTRTAEEMAACATGQGCQALWGRCYEGEGRAALLWPWVQPLRDYVQLASPDQLLAQMGPGAADIAEIVPELRTYRQSF